MRKVKLSDLEAQVKQVEAKTNENPDCYVDIMKMTDRIMEINKPNVKILTDYDADGITSAYIMDKAISSFYGKDISVEVCCNDRRGSYGVGSFLQQETNTGDTQYIILDMGSNEVKEIMEKFGDDALVIDHHLFADENDKIAARKMDNVLNPKMYDNPADYCTAGLTYRIFSEMLERTEKLQLGLFSQQVKNDLLIMATIGSCADVVSVLDENSFNRQMIRVGLNVINNKKAETSFTVGKILDTVLDRSADNTAHTVAFDLGAFFNAGSRMSSILQENGAQKIMDILLKDIPEGEDKAYFEHLQDLKIARITEINAVRKSLMGEIKESADYRNAVEYYSKSDDSVVVYILDNKYPSNFCGLVAGQLKEVTGKACICLMEMPDGTFTGSGRNADENESLNEYLKKITEGMDIQYGGHHNAIGISYLASSSELEERIAATPIKHQDTELVILDEDVNDKNFLSRLYALEPIGQGLNLPPVLINGKITKVSDISSKNPNGIWKNLTIEGVDTPIKDWNYDAGKFILDKSGNPYLLCDVAVNIFRKASLGITVKGYPKNFKDEIDTLENHKNIVEKSDVKSDI